MFESDLGIEPLLAHSALEMGNVSHPHPRKMCWPCEIVINFFLCQAQLLPYSGEDCLTCNRSKRHIEAVHCHPIDLLFPLFPSPERSSISISADIIIKMM